MNPRIPSFDSIAFNPTVTPFTPFSNPFYGKEITSLLIISPDDFIPALQPLIDHKNKSGIPTMAVSISDLKAHFGGVDDPEKIKHGIKYAYENLFIRYVMLVGDAHMFPVRYMFYHCLSKNYPDKLPEVEDVPSDGDYIASDLYYSNLYHHAEIDGSGVKPRFDNWDANRNGLYNEGWWAPYEPKGTTKYDMIPDLNPDNVDGYPDVAIGRVPAHTVTDVTAYVNKIISYESSTTRYQISRERKFTFVEDKEYGSGSLTPGILSGPDLISNAFVSTDFLMIENDDNPPFKTGGLDWKNASPDDVAKYANQSDWVSYIGHGGPKSWGYYGVFGEDHVKSTATSNALPVVFAGACQTGEFIADFPWNAPYVDVSGTKHEFSVIPKSTDGYIEDKATGKKLVLDSSNNCEVNPVIMPKPSQYDFDRGDWAFAHPWLIANAPGGAIAYFGEMGVAPDTMAVELETYMLGAYGSEYNPILGDIFLKAQRKYWDKNIHGPDSTEASPRMFLGWMVFFGDPSLRLPRIIDPPISVRVIIDELQAALGQGKIRQEHIQIAEAYLTNLRSQLVAFERKFPRQ